MRGVIVLGMHRSGTSAVTRVINLLGVPLGRTDDIYSASDNPSGHWESEALCAVNDMILKAFGGFDMAMPPMPRLWVDSRRAGSLRAVMRATFDDVYRGERWLWKDPRLCLTLPLWRRVLDDFCVVFVIRDARPVTRSLRRREGFPTFFCYGLWDDYNRRAVAALQGLPVVRVDFEEMVRDPHGEVTRLSESLTSLGVVLDGDVEGAAASVHSPTAEPADPDLGRELAAALRSGPSVSPSFSRPTLPAQPLWVRPLLRARCSWLKVREGWTDRVRIATGART